MTLSVRINDSDLSRLWLEWRQHGESSAEQRMQSEGLYMSTQRAAISLFPGSFTSISTPAVSCILIGCLAAGCRCLFLEGGGQSSDSQKLFSPSDHKNPSLNKK